MTDESDVNAASGAGAPKRDAMREVQTLTELIGDMEGQLDRVMASNDALKADLEAERDRRIGLEETVEQLRDELRRSQQEVADVESLQAEVKHLNQERSRLTTTARNLTDKLSEAQRELHGNAAAIERLRAARDDAFDEVRSVEAQFERSMQMVAEVRAQVRVLTEERDALEGQLRTGENRLAAALRERDSLYSEVEQSRAAIDDIRRSLSAASVAAGEAEAGEVTQ